MKIDTVEKALLYGAATAFVIVAVCVAVAVVGSCIEDCEDAPTAQLFETK